MGRAYTELGRASSWSSGVLFVGLLCVNHAAHAQASNAAGVTAPPAQAPAPAVASAPPLPAVASAPAAPSRTPVFVALGVGAIATGSAVLTGIFANSEYQSAKSDCSPRCSDGDLSAGRTLAVASTIFTGIAIVGVGLGVTLLLLEERSEEPGAASFALGVTPDFGGARASAAWRF